MSPLLPNTIPMADIRHQSGHALPWDLNMASGSRPPSTLEGCHNVICDASMPSLSFPTLGVNVPSAVLEGGSF